MSAPEREDRTPVINNRVASRRASLAFYHQTGLRPQEAAGLRYTALRHNGALVSVYNGQEAGLDTAEGEQPWSTLCERHNWVCSYETLGQAMDYATRPADWCERCAGTEPEE